MPGFGFEGIIEKHRGFAMEIHGIADVRWLIADWRRKSRNRQLEIRNPKEIRSPKAGLAARKRPNKRPGSNDARSGFWQATICRLPVGETADKLSALH